MWYELEHGPLLQSGLNLHTVWLYKTDVPSKSKAPVAISKHMVVCNPSLLRYEDLVHTQHPVPHEDGHTAIEVWGTLGWAVPLRNVFARGRRSFAALVTEYGST